MSSSDFSDSDLDISPELLERERQLISRSNKVQAQITSILQDYEIEDEPNKQILKPPARVPQPKVSAKLPKAKQNSRKSNIIDVEVPENILPPPKVTYDPTPELRAAYHKIFVEIENVQQQISDIQSSTSQAELQIAKLQAELKKMQLENERSTQTNDELTNQITESRERVKQLKTSVEEARLARIERLQIENDAQSKRSSIESKIRKRRALSDQLQIELSSLQNTDARAAKAMSDKASLQKVIENEKKGGRQVKALLDSLRKAIENQEKIYEHLQTGKTVGLSNESIQRICKAAGIM